jgi:hypothetical protein
MFGGIRIQYADVNDLDEVLKDRNHLLCWWGRPVMETGGFVEQMLVQHPMVIRIGSVRSRLATRIGSGRRPGTPYRMFPPFRDSVLRTPQNPKDSFMTEVGPAVSTLRPDQMIRTR